ncbi:hypothetical protein GCM10022224_042180 [Nonomuraea antimicrobica]|uniref:Uncharacterized protein n=1 Tax=Nonomuraea antimicrobica TaxID=561173 RepID=A0ABP7C1R1_9ACTN
MIVTINSSPDRWNASAPLGASGAAFGTNATPMTAANAKAAAKGSITGQRHLLRTLTGVATISSNSS